jgi:hypothetical protein
VNFWAALIFASLYQDKEDRRKVNTNEGEDYKDSIPELLGIYNCETDTSHTFSAGLVSRSNLTLARAFHMIRDCSIHAPDCFAGAG